MRSSLTPLRYRETTAQLVTTHGRHAWKVAFAGRKSEDEAGAPNYASLAREERTPPSPAPLMFPREQHLRAAQLRSINSRGRLMHKLGTSLITLVAIML